jgi:sulfur carrier protein
VVLLATEETSKWIVAQPSACYARSDMSLSIILNGQPRVFETLEPPVSLAQLVAELQLKGDRIAVELNGEIAPRAQWQTAALATGDRLEVVHFVGGGSVAHLKLKISERQ